MARTGGGGSVVWKHTSRSVVSLCVILSIYMYPRLPSDAILLVLAESEKTRSRSTSDNWPAPAAEPIFSGQSSY